MKNYSYIYTIIKTNKNNKSKLNIMSKYRDLIQNPPKFSIKQNPTEVVFHLVSCMCDNKKMISFKKVDGEFQMNRHGQAYSNFQFKYEQYELTWAADAGNWDKVILILQSGTVAIERIESRK